MLLQYFTMNYFLCTSIREIINVVNSVTGTDSHIPVTPNTLGSIKRYIVIKMMPRNKDRSRAFFECSIA